MKRRAFLERIGSILAVLGLTEAEWLTLGNRYYQALAAPNPRKLALLIGINQYPQSPALGGCLTDVELQREVLIHRCGFAAADILTLTEEQASREFIEAAFVDHLGKQAQAGDVVVFHFSGYGSRVKLGTFPETVQNALIPVDEKEPQDRRFVNYLLEETLLLLLRSLPTDRVTAVLDTSYYTPTTLQPSGLQIRARPELPATQLALPELEFLKQLQTQKSAINQAMVLKATSDPNQQAGELLFSGWSAGLFTYALTQYLWEATPATTIQILFSHLSSSMHRLGSEQQPELMSGLKNTQSSSIVDSFPLDDIGAEGVVNAIDEDGKTVEVWLGGLLPQVLEYYGVGSRFTLPTGEQLILRSSLKTGVTPSRTGLIAKAEISNPKTSNPPQVGQLVQEEVRVLPPNINLTVALDSGLERIERVDATSAFASITRMVNIALAEQSADYVFGKLPQIPSRYGLFSLGGEQILNTAGEMGEAVKVAVQRLTPKFSTLLAAKLWRLTENEGSSRLAVKGTLEIISTISPRTIIQKQTWRSQVQESGKDKAIINSGTTVPSIPVGSRMQYKVKNLSDRPIYLILLGLNNARSAFGYGSPEAIALYPWQVSPETDSSDTKPHLREIVIPPRETLKLPQSDATTGWMLPMRAFFCEHQLIISTSPFTQTQKALETPKYATADQQSISPLVNPLEVAQALLQDLHNANETEMNGTATDSYILDVNNWASLNFSFQVV
ncbi:caspase family protein [Anabaena cylindrica FACHB-243]|uniref:Peptidase C14 caspase catalytic subunit p20 n=1 Tax=Anabaena cylindrica (strain ATCC 27899 / PCC 7122) TaxID=272123 RepID=K9ZHU0_ANACC|nr:MULTISPECIES: caspase family protein [Anabaena]AFZ58137.1 peptidase C14 caspase catalytic subunit p20 [Anabaena cylindrica PCC 7122]MBD2419088.1 caspase family protein [Anabaena cylindrica FACHB-243]MBY5281235.1 caspase family protein [Anabaena sp. CCAP 1446/1C]MBY5310304.1 caspase family protein [Anabaena sp. CCAP 1446/1C]MCM2409558.1 caspase family protein [Anabaena sp. CCAP 1446/1C]